MIAAINEIFAWRDEQLRRVAEEHRRAAEAHREQWQEQLPHFFSAGRSTIR
jgi:hypothetical protein